MSKGKAFVRSVIRYEKELRAYFLRRMSSRADAEDLTQEVILRALCAAERQEIEQPRAFLYGVARNVLRSEVTKKSQSIIHYIEDLGASEDFSTELPLEEAIEARAAWRDFAEAVNSLPEQCQKVFVMKKVYGYSMKEIASKLDISPSTVEKHVAAGLKRLVQVKTAQQSAKAGSSTVRLLRPGKRS
ncbi:MULTISPECIES: RNA polymerase sigma factor [Hyphococcus]|nr:RNA polymerase sigma factor [Marinicaulis flavus]